ncbi:hypothetical protein GA0115240_10669 [Streptomyces sp. DvalAA-14]|uniref:hypothetical protein n=1 Tax=unclassified Streptomyces TaxID=2593676 RepID=UPI00081B9432|nr:MULTISPECIES: hypothetical protein [unclassified Streptomyces]MYS19240.1 hypothetical protein [Streptomyces sp. SID4948]SCD39981.1 hypothetical protein GA0115240_10669 [Streptomyces sp. DvalAA-14]
MSSVIDATRGVLLELGIHPLALAIDAGGARLSAVMDDSALRTRSRGPYSPENLPPEALEMVDAVLLRGWHRPRPEFTIEGGGKWPGLLVQFHAEWVAVRYVVPEAVPPELYVPPPGQVTLSGDIRLALEQLANSLRIVGRHLGAEPPLALSLSYPDDPDYDEARAESLPEEWRDVLPPVVAALDIDRSGFTREQREAHDEALRQALYGGQGWEQLGRTGFRVRTGYACLRDGGT